MFDAKLASHLAELSKISFSDSELNEITKEMDEIITLMDTVSDFEMAENPAVNPALGLDKIRKDAPTESMPRNEILKNASVKTEKAFTVPKVV